MAWGPSGYTFTLTPGASITIWFWWKDFAPQGVQLARPLPDVLAPDERTSSDLYGDCRLVASDDAVERLKDRQYRYSVTVWRDPALGQNFPVAFHLAGGTLA